MFKIFFTSSAEKELQKLSDADIKRIILKISSLSENPNPSGCKKIKGRKGLWRIRSGSYRIIYTIFRDKLIIEVIRIRHRKEIYRGI